MFTSATELSLLFYQVSDLLSFTILRLVELFMRYNSDGLSFRDIWSLFRSVKWRLLWTRFFILIVITYKLLDLSFYKMPEYFTFHFLYFCSYYSRSFSVYFSTILVQFATGPARGFPSSSHHLRILLCFQMPCIIPYIILHMIIPVFNVKYYNVLYLSPFLAYALHPSRHITQM